MGIILGLTFTVYVVVGVCLCFLILANEDAESISNSSPISPVKSTQRGSFVNYLISTLAFMFLSFCILLNRMTGRSIVDSIVLEETRNDSAGDFDNNDFSTSENDVIDPSVSGFSELQIKDKTDEIKDKISNDLSNVNNEFVDFLTKKIEGEK